MKWIEELRERVRVAGKGEKTEITVSGKTAMSGPYALLVDRITLGRLIEITKGAEWYMNRDYDEFCPICGANKVSGHYSHCPYSDEWVKP